ncbi:MAG: arabinan endo-1,5-alpha-L-arabinosidase, partial [Lachnospiraceae bacterium]|nr:arabinan endo-1,5-alpha-L-arabinosidase [Lachnospiraceae bacterium]
MGHGLEFVKEPPKDCLNSEAGRMQPGLWMTHDPAAYYDKEKDLYYIYSTGAIGKVSKDLVHFTSIGKVVSHVPTEAKEWTGSEDIWAPDLVKVGDEYRLYCSNSSWGVQRSCIFLAVSDCPEGPFEPRGIVLKSEDCLPVNAIDANIIRDHHTGEMYMLYGSFWGGCYVLPLEEESGLSKHVASANWSLTKEGTVREPLEDIIGTCVAKRPAWMSGAIEGPYMIYREETGDYYLFVSYGSLKTDYQIRVGRSKSITGPFVDARGRSLLDVEDGENSVGNLIMAGYQWNDGVPYMAPGHNSVVRGRGGDTFLVCHLREKNFTPGMNEPSTMQVRKLYFSADGWPYVAPEVYALDVEDMEETSLTGSFERIDFHSTLPQGISVATPMKLGQDGYFEHCSIQGTWKKVDASTLEISYGPHREEV